MIQTNNVKILAKLWNKQGEMLTCPQCNSNLTLVQLEPIADMDNPYTPYKTIIECPKCNFKLETESFTILGGIKEYDTEHVEIGSWSPSGSRVVSKYKHFLDFTVLSELKRSGALVEFLIVNKQVVHVIG
jgi:hypothetical protein